MPRSSRQKLKILYLAKYLMEHTDEDHPVSVQQLISMLAQNDISAERKSIYSDLEELEQFGLDICCTLEKNTNYYFIGSRTFQLAELEMLIDSVQASKFITEKKTRELIGKLQTLASSHQAQALKRQVYVKNRIKSMNETVFINIDALHAAISQDKQIEFLYFEYDLQKKKAYRKNGKTYCVSPYALIWDNENYYMLAYDESAGIIKHYRVDKMTKITTTDRARIGSDTFAQLDMSEYTKRAFSMFGGKEEHVTIRFANHLVGVVLDRFGKDVILARTDADHFSITTPVIVSPQFFGFLFSLGDEAEILQPERVRGEMQKQLRAVSEKY